MTELRHSLAPFFRPRSVAVVGADDVPGHVGSRLLLNSLDSASLADLKSRVIYPVNPLRTAVHGVRCYPNVATLPETPDLAVIASPAATVPQLVAECAARGIPAALIVSGGLGEQEPAGRELARQVRQAARGRLRLIGPDSLGVIHPPSQLNASFAAVMPRAGQVALLSQSGAICTSILDWARTAHVGFSGFVSVGSMLDVDFADLIDYFADDPATRSIVLYMESIGDVRKFLSAARSASRMKPLIVVKAGRHEAAARAAASHTGAVVGADAVFDAAFRRAGVLRVETIPDLFNMSEILAMQPQPRGPALAVVTNAGGPGVMAADALLAAGGQLAALGAGTLAALNSLLPPAWSHGNPVDLLGDATPEQFREAVQVVARDPGVQGVLVLLSPQALTEPTETARQVAPFAQGTGKPVLGCWLGGDGVRAGRDILGRAGVPTFDSPESAVRAFLHMVQFRRNQELLYERPGSATDHWVPDTERVKAIIARARAECRVLLNEADAKQLLAAYGLPAVPATPCLTMQEAVAAANRVGFPVVVKLLSGTVTHKSEVGGVKLNLTDEASVCAAFESIRNGLFRRNMPEAFDGVTVQPMVKDAGVELIIGSFVDRQFGPVIVFGSGGVLVEVFQDSSLALPPLNRTLARRLMERTRIHAALQGVRGQPPANLEALEVLLVRFSRLLTDCRELQEVDLNPVLAGPERVLALDARVVLRPVGGDAPLLAITPYPDHLTAPFRLRDGSEVVVRAVRPEDEELIVALHGRHSEHTIRMRFFSLVKVLSRDSLIRLCHLDYDREMALAAVREDSEGRRILGVSRYYLEPATGAAEFALVVEDAFQRQGLGRHLMERLIGVAREQGVGRLVGQVLRENVPMLALLAELGFEPPRSLEDGVVQVELALNG